MVVVFSRIEVFDVDLFLNWFFIFLIFEEGIRYRRKSSDRNFFRSCVLILIGIIFIFES